MANDITVDEFITQQAEYDRKRRILYPFIRALVPTFCKIDVKGLENVPRQGPASLMINHVSYLDPIAVTWSIPFRYVISLSKAENFRIPVISWFLKQWGNYPIHRGDYDRKALMQTIALMQSGQLVLMAPEGTRHPDGLLPAKDGLAYVATKADAVIVPTAICGANDWEQRLKSFRRACVHLVFGKPFRFRTDSRKRIPRDQLSLMSTEAMYQLAQTIPDDYARLRGFYSDIENASMNHIEFV